MRVLQLRIVLYVVLFLFNNNRFELYIRDSQNTKLREVFIKNLGWHKIEYIFQGQFIMVTTNKLLWIKSYNVIKKLNIRYTSRKFFKGTNVNNPNSLFLFSFFVVIFLFFLYYIYFF